MTTMSVLMDMVMVPVRGSLEVDVRTVLMPLGLCTFVVVAEGCRLGQQHKRHQK